MVAPTAQRTEAVIDGFHAWMRLCASMVLATIGGVGIWSVVVVLPAVQAEFAADRAAASLPYTLAMVGFALGNLLIGRVMDRTGIFLPMLLSAVALGAGHLLAAMAPSILMFTVVHALIGFGSAACFGPMMADVSHWFVRWRGVAVAAAGSGSYFAGALWPLAMQLTLPTEGWRVTYVAIGLICLAAMVPMAFLLRRRAPEGAAAGASVSIAPVATGLSPRALQTLLAIAGVGCCVAMSMPQVHIVAYCVDLGFGVARGSEMLALMLAGGVASRIASGFLADRIGGIRTVLLGSALQCAALVAYIPFDGLASLYMVSLVFGLSQGGIVPSYVIVIREYLPAREAGRRVGVVIMATIAGMALGGWMSGWIYDLTGSYTAAFLNGIAWNLLNIAIMLFVLWRARGGRAGAVPA